MLRTGRSLLLLLSFLSLQLSLISGGERCPLVRIFAENGSGMKGMDMAGMDMAGMDMAGMDMSSMKMAAPRGGDEGGARSPHHDEQSCDSDGSDTDCDSMMVCLFAAVTSPAGTHALRSSLTERLPIIALRAPPTEGTAPDLPPPRLRS